MNFVRKSSFPLSPLACWGVLFFVQVIIAGYYWHDLPLSGDEHVYFRYSNGILKGDFSELYGRHFMPGTGILIALPKLIYNEANIRIFMAIFNLALAGLAVRSSPFNTRSKILFFIFLIISPMVIYFSFRYWGDLVAGYFLLFVGLFFVRAAHHNWKLSILFLMGASCAIIMYFRHNFLFLGPFIFLGLMALQITSNKPFTRLVSQFFKQGLALLIGFFLLWTPWVVASSIKHDRLIIHPSLIEPYKQSTIWALTPPGSDQARRQTPAWGRLLFERAESLLIADGFLTENDRWQGLHEFDGRDFSDVRLQGEELGYSKFLSPKGTKPRKAWIKAIRTAIKDIQIETQQNMTVSKRISASSRNFKNIFGTPNQFLADGLAAKGVEFAPQSGIFSTKLSYKRGDKDRMSYKWPTNLAFGSLLVFNGLVYLFILLSALAFLFSRKLSKTEHTFRIYTGGAILSFMVIIFVHPGHGRYIFQLMPLLIFCAALFWSKRIQNVFRSGQNI